MASASEKVFNTVELLEMVLLKLPAWKNTLLLSQRVSKHWKGGIEGSSKIQEALFFKYIDCGGEPVQLCPEGPDGYSVKTHDGRPSALRDAFVNPLTLLCFYNAEDISCVPSIDELPKSWRREEASWRKMIAMQPSISAEALVMPSRGEPYDTPFNTGTTTLEDFLDFLDDLEINIPGDRYEVMERCISFKCQCQQCDGYGSIRLFDTNFAEPLESYQQLGDLKADLDSVEKGVV